MNLEILGRWGQRALGVLDRLETRAERRDSHDKLQARLGWVRPFRDHLTEWEALLDVAITSECFVRERGLWEGAEVELSERLEQGVVSPRVLALRAQLLAFVKSESLKGKPGEQLLGSSEVIESVPYSVFVNQVESGNVSQGSEITGTFKHARLWNPQTGLLVGFLWWMGRRAMNQQQSIFGMGKSQARRFHKEGSPAVTFDDVAGADGSKAQLQEIVELLKAPERFQSLGARIPRGVLLIGPPGAVTRPSCRATSRAHWTRSSWATSAPWPSTRRQDG
jgi:hypothetical protein